MHSMILVVGENPLGQVAETCPPGSIDEAAIGGRFTGLLLPQPGKTGKRYGDAPTSFEAAIAALMPDGVNVGRPGARGDREGVDQIRADHVDWDATREQGDTGPRAVVSDGMWHDLWDVLTAEEMAALTIAALTGEESEYLASARRKVEQWDRETLGPILAAAGVWGELVTVVDIHE